MRKITSFLTSTDGVVLGCWALMSLVFGLSLATGPYTLTEQITFLVITLGFGSFLVYAFTFHRGYSLRHQNVAKAEEQKTPN